MNFLELVIRHHLTTWTIYITLSINWELSLADKLFLYLTIFCVYCSANYVLLLLPLLLHIDCPFCSHFKYHWWGRGRDGLNVFSKWDHNGDCEKVKYHQKIHIWKIPPYNELDGGTVSPNNYFHYSIVSINVHIFWSDHTRESQKPK